MSIGHKLLDIKNDNSLAHTLLNVFDALEPVEQHCIAAEIMRRSVAVDDLSNAMFDELAAGVFNSYDAEESSGAEPS